MSAIPDGQIDRYKYILMYDDERVVDAIVTLRDAGGQDWWHLVVDLEGGGYAAAPFSALVNGLEEQGKPFLERPLGELVGTTLAAVEVIVEQAKADLDDIRRRAAESECQIAVVLKEGELRGVLAVGTMRSATHGLFDTGLAQLAGRYAELPERGLLSRRRIEARAAKGRRSPGGSKGPSASHTEGTGDV